MRMALRLPSSLRRCCITGSSPGCSPFFRKGRSGGVGKVEEVFLGFAGHKVIHKVAYAGWMGGGG